MTILSCNRINCLGMLSFNLDFKWRNSEKDENQPKDDYKMRLVCSGNESDYSFTNYYAYLCYLPLYFAGPIITFNDFNAQVHKFLYFTD